MITIRPYQKKDFRFVQDICVATAKLKHDTPSTRTSLCAMYCDYYLDQEPEFCFVAVDENDLPVGYVLCSVDAGNYQEAMSELYLPVVRKLSSGDYFPYAAEVKFGQRIVKQGYEAHIHVDILEEYQHQGIGTMLVEKLLGTLKEAGVANGVYLMCGKNNKAGCAFYEKLGFEDFDYFANCVVYALALNGDEE